MTFEMNNSSRQKKYQRSEKLETLMDDVNNLLLNPEKKLIQNCHENQFPVIFIIGNPRSGTTLLLQWLASLGCFAYPTNTLSRFYKAPCIGAKIQKMLTVYDFKGELFNPSYEENFFSDLGKTKGPLAPHEFWYFWRRFFHYGEIQKLKASALKNVDKQMLLSEIAGLENEFNMPLVFKGMMFNWNIDFIHSLFQKVLFINLEREPLYNIDSLLHARESFFGSLDNWYSFKPPEYYALKGKKPIEQVAGQVLFTNKAIEQQFQRIPDEKKINFSYESLCRNPTKLYKEIAIKFADQGFLLPEKYNGIKNFIIKNKYKTLKTKNFIQKYLIQQ
jgi:hypothetical protein